MLLLLRFLRVVIAGLLAPRRRVLDESVLHFRVWPNDIDLNLHLNDGRYVSLMGLGRAHLLASNGMLRKCLQMKWAPVVAGVIIRYRREVRSFAKLALRSRVIGWDEKWIYIEHAIERGGKKCAVAYVRGALRSSSGAVPTSVILDVLGWVEPSPPLPEIVAKWPEIDV